MDHDTKTNLQASDSGKEKSPEKSSNVEPNRVTPIEAVDDKSKHQEEKRQDPKVMTKEYDAPKGDSHSNPSYKTMPDQINKDSLKI